MKGLVITSILVLFTVVSSVNSDPTIVDVKNEEDLEQRLANAGDKLILLYFYASGRDEFNPKIKSVLEELLATYPDNLVIFQVDIIALPNTVKQYNVRSTPYLQLRKTLRHEKDLLDIQKDAIFAAVEAAMHD